MSFYSLACCLALVIGSTPALAINKCTGKDGAVVFQDAPCPGKGEKLVVKPATGDAPTAASAPQSTTDRLNAQLQVMQRDRQRTELEYALQEAQNRQAGNSRACEADFERLRALKARANNNLAGATWENSISQEMSAVATRCDTKNRELMASIGAITKECRALGGCK